MTDLDKALEHVEVYPQSIEVAHDADPQPIVDAARRVADLKLDAATAVTNQLRFVKSGDEWDDLIYDITKEAVMAALSITEDTE